MVLERVKQIAAEEPARIHMNFELIRRDDPFGSLGRHHQFPACGTIGCVKGWSHVVLNTPETIRARIYISDGAFLGLSEEQARELFMPQREDGRLVGINDIAQTPEHARNVIAHITWFQQKYADQLKSFMCEPYNGLGRIRGNP
jgi:hypothetical protein